MIKRKIYVASSWRNHYQEHVVELLRQLGHEVYDFKNPPHGDSGFAWSEIDEKWLKWTTEQYSNALNHPLAQAGFKSDFDGMQWADTCVMVLPCGRSANTEAGWMKGAGKEVFVFTPIEQEPELMYKIHDGIIGSFEELKDLFTMSNRITEPHNGASQQQPHSSTDDGHQNPSQLKEATILSAEEVLNKYFRCCCSDTYKSRDMPDPECIIHHDIDEIVAAMEEYHNQFK